MDLFGFLAICVAAIGYGSYYVPVKRHEVHDGLVFQWYQSSGILIGGLIWACSRNDWDAPPGTSQSFTMAPEGLLFGVIYQLANILAIFAVKTVGIGVYYTVHEVTNLGGAFIIGVFGPQLGLPVQPPRNVALAFFGVLSVMLGGVPIAFMRPEGKSRSSEKESTNRAPEEPRQSRLNSLFDEQAPATASENTSLKAASPEPGSAVSGKSSATPSLSPTLASQNGPALRSGLPDLRLPAGRRPSAASGGVASPPDWREMNSRTWDGVLGRPLLGSDDDPLSPLYFHAGPTMAGVADNLLPDEEEGDDLLRQEMHSSHSKLERGQAFGLGLSLLAGVVFSVMWLPMLVWTERMKVAGVNVSSFDFVFSLCVGLYLTSTMWLLGGGLWKRYSGKPMLKTVLRPALAGGFVWATSLVFQLYALLALPYAIAYCSIVGGALAVSLLWGILRFGEASSTYNRKCVMLSFSAVLVGVVLLGVSGH